MNNENYLEDLRELLVTSDSKKLSVELEYIHPVDILEVLHEYPEDNEIILEKLSDEQIAELLDFEEDEDKYELLMHFSLKRQKNILEEMSSDEITNLMENLDEEEKEEILEMMDKEDREEVTELLSYKEDSAGSLMATEFINIWEDKTILTTLEYLHTAVEEAEMVYYLYVTDKEGHLKGVVSLRDIVSTDFNTPISEITNPNVISAHVNDDQEAVAQFFAKYDFLMIPVVDDDNIIRGVITVDDVIDIIQEEATEDIHRMAGLDEEEKVDGTILDSIRSRLPWLTVNLFTAALSAAVITVFSDTIQAVVALAALNPIIAGMGGNAGNQSMTLVVRAIALGEIEAENGLKIFFKEFFTGCISGLTLGLLLTLVSTLLYGNAVLGIVAGCALMCNLIIATVCGFLVPVILKKLNVDPALASSVFVTTCTDVLGFLIFLGLATAFLPYIL